MKLVPQIYQVFPTLIYHSKLNALAKKSDSVFRRQLLKEAYLLREQDLAGQAWSKKNYPKGYTSYGSIDRLHRFSPTFEHLAAQIQTHVDVFIKKSKFAIKLRDLELTSLWVNIMSEGTQHTLHVHPRAVISGTYYLAMPKPIVPLKFEDPRLTKFMNRPEVAVTGSPLQKNYFHLEPKVGDLILFESWVRHEVGRVAGFVDRVSVSFNWNWK